MTKRPKPAADSADRNESNREQRALDEALEDSFPASDPPSLTGASTGAPDHPRDGGKQNPAPKA